MVALVDAPDLYEKQEIPWTTPVHGLDMTAARRFVSNCWYAGRATPEQLLLEPKCLAELDYVTLESPDVQGEAGWSAARSGTAHGLSVWFESELAPGVDFSSGPDHPELVYGSAFFPLSEPVSVVEGDRIDFGMRADLVGEAYVWSWNTRVRAPEPANETRADFRQSTFYASPMSKAQLHKRAAAHRPKLTEDGEIALLILRLMNENHTLESIARQVCAGYPGRFADWATALGHVSAMSGEYSETPGDGGPKTLGDSRGVDSTTSSKLTETSDG
jgi:protein arginine N-methyltransferase 1